MLCLRMISNKDKVVLRDVGHVFSSVCQRVMDPSGPPSARQMVFRWRADGGPTLYAGWDIIAVDIQ